MANEYKGSPAPTERHLVDRGFGTLDLLSLSREEIEGKKVLDIGIGGGVAVGEALLAGMDVIGFDILPAYSIEDIRKIAQYDERDAKIVIERTEMLKDLAKTNPSKIVAGDGTVSLPFTDDSFDIVTSTMALPGYAQTEAEAKRAINEMLRVARERVVFSQWSSDKDGLFTYGIQGHEFKFDLFGYLDGLKDKGVFYKVKTAITGDKSIHIDCSRKSWV